MQTAIPVRNKVPKFRAILFTSNHEAVVELLGASGQKYVLTDSPGRRDLVVHMPDGEPIVVKWNQYVVLKGRDIEVLDQDEYFRKYEIDPEAKPAERGAKVQRQDTDGGAMMAMSTTRTTADDLHLRHQALDYAIRSHAATTDSDAILPAARDYLKFLKGE
jgi:hypothetical protein